MPVLKLLQCSDSETLQNLGDFLGQASSWARYHAEVVVWMYEARVLLLDFRISLSFLASWIAKSLVRYFLESMAVRWHHDEQTSGLHLKMEVTWWKGDFMNTVVRHIAATRRNSSFEIPSQHRKKNVHTHSFLINRVSCRVLSCRAAKIAPHAPQTSAPRELQAPRSSLATLTTTTKRTLSNRASTTLERP